MRLRAERKPSAGTLSVPKAWAEGFDFYFTDLGDRPASVLVDLNAGPHAPLDSHPVVLGLFVTMQRPRDNGLRSEEEAQQLFSLEDALVAEAARLEALYLGRVVTAGRTDLFFYGPRGLTAAQVERALSAARGSYRIAVYVKEDPEWGTYLQVLYPTATELQLMMNRRLVERRLRSGDDPTAVREVDHLALLPDEQSARSTAEKLQAAGFRTGAPTPPAEGAGHQMWSLPFHRRDAVTQQRADAFTLEILALLEGTGAHYDGWGAVTVPHSS